MNELYYIANVRLPTEKAHGIQILKMCSAFKKQGAKVNLIVPRRWFYPKTSINVLKKLFNLHDTFQLTFLFNLDLLKFKTKYHVINSLIFLVQNISFTLSAYIFALRKRGIVYTRNKLFAILFIISQRQIVYEAHDVINHHPIDKILAKKCSLIIAITKSISRSYQKNHAHVFYYPDGVDKEFFKKVSKKSARKAVNIPFNQKVVVYTGSLYKWKGVDCLINAAKKISNIVFYFIGGNEAEVKQYRDKTKNYKNIIFKGHLPYSQISNWLKAADILVIPNSNKYLQSSKHTSPLKLFEYLTSGTPVLAAKVPAIKEIVNSDQVVFFTPDNSNSLVSRIKWMMSSKCDIRKQASGARQLAEKYTWENRAKNILEKIHESMGTIPHK